MFRLRVLFALVFAFALAALPSAAAQDCPRGQLAEPFCDEDGDMVADAPTDPSQWLDPSTLVFAYTPVEDPALYQDVWAEFVAHLEEVTGRRVQFFPVQNNAAQLEALRAGRLHIAGVNTGSVPYAVNLAGFVPFTIMAGPEGEYGYEMEIIVHRDSDIETLEDLRGRELAFTSPTSNSGFQAPSALLRAEFGMEADVDYRTVFSGAHDNSVLGVANRDYEAAAIANEVMHRMFARGVVDEDEIRTVYTSETFPTTGYGYLYNLHPDLIERIREAFFSFDWEGTALADEFEEANMTQFIPVTYLEHWAVVRTINDAQGVEYR